MRRILLAFIVLLLAAIPALSHFIAAFFFLPRLEQRDRKFERLWPRIHADLERLDKEPLFPKLTFDHEAETLLAQYISWEGVAVEAPVDQQASRLRALFAKYPYWKTIPGQARKIVDDADGKTLDAEWMAQLHTLDHWPVHQRQEIRDGLERAKGKPGVERIAVFSTLPIPDFSDLRRWASLYSLRHKSIEMMKEAARLSYSTGLLVGNMNAVALLQDAREICTLLNLKTCDVPAPETIGAFKRVSWAWASIARSSFMKSVSPELLAFAKVENGICASAWEMGLGLSAYQDFLAPQWPFETDFRPALGRAADYHRSLIAKCHLTELSVMLEPTDPPLRPFTLPYVRRIFGLELIAFAEPDYLQIYDREKSSPGLENADRDSGKD